MNEKNKAKKIELKRAIAELEKPYPSDDLITNYADFLKARTLLHFHQFNPIVFDNLLKLVIEEWTSTKRISRLSLLQVLKRYFHVSVNETSTKRYFQSKRLNYPFSIETKTQLFLLFQKIFEEPNYINPNQLDEAKAIVNNMLINIALTEKEESWLCKNAYQSDLILNRLLRYPIQSSTISEWAKNHYKSDFIRLRRAEIVGWLLDEEVTFEVDNSTIIEDFEYLNSIDIKAVKDFEEEVSLNRFIENELNNLPQDNDEYVNYDFSEGRYLRGHRIGLSTPELKLTKRYYIVPSDRSKNYAVSIPDFDLLREEFYSNVELSKKFTMIWAIAYSRLEIALKTELFKKYYCDETYNTMLKIAQRFENKALLAWMLEVQ